MEFSELLEHLDDLLDLARSEGFTAFAGQLQNFRNAVHHNRAAFDVRVLAGDDPRARPGPEGGERPTLRDA